MQESQSNVPFIIMVGSNNHSKKKKKKLFEKATALFIQLKETMSERRLNSLLTAASTIWLNRHPY